MGSPLRIAIAGAGRMGQSIAGIAGREQAFELAGIWARGDDLNRLVASADVLIDFSLPAGTAEVLTALERQPRPLVCGVSGLDAAQLTRLKEAATRIPIVYDRNMSKGITALDDALYRVAAALGDEFEVRIQETHHVHKKDAPSGTALKLGETLAAARGIDPRSIDYQSERRGEVPGDHTVVFTAPTEVLSLSHRVTTRAVFAEGALSAAAWVANRPPGLYSMRDVLFGGQESGR